MSIILLEDVKSYLNINDTDTDSDIIINNLIPSAVKFIENYCQRNFVITETADRFDGTFCDYHVFHKYPVNKILSIDMNKENTLNYILEEDIVYLEDYNKFKGKCVIKYEVGYSDINMPEDLKLACVELVAFWYKKKDVVDVASKGLGNQNTTFINKDMPEFIKVKLLNYEAKF